MSYDNWKLASPEDSQGPWDRPEDDVEYVHCSLCDKSILDGHGDNGRIGRLYMCGECFDAQESVIQGRAHELSADTRRNK